MAESRVPGILGVPYTTLTPARTPGPLGFNDSADPTRTTRLGNTPGILGVGDFADPTLTRLDRFPASQFGRACRNDDGVAIARSLESMPPLVPVTNGEILLELAQEMALKITTVFEGGKSMNYQALADDTDYQATSFGLIQWNFGQGTLGPLLKKMLNQDPTAFAGCFSAGADYDTLKKAINDGKINDQTKWARKLLASSKGKAAWKSAFESLGKVAAFNKIQREQAAANYHPSVVSCVAKLRSLDSKLMQDVSFRTYAALFDLSVQQGDLKKAAEQIDAAFVTEKPKTQAALVRLAVVERAKAANPIYVADCISRRCGILDGACFESTENKMTAKRENSQLTLIVDFGECRVCDL